MALESVFLNLIRGNRVSQYMGLQLPQGQTPKFGGGGQYAYVEIGLAPTDEFNHVNTEGAVTAKKLLRNQHVYIQPDCKVHVKGDYHLLVEPNPALAEFGQVQAPYWIHSGEGEKVPGFWITLRRDVLVSEIKHAVRLYLQA